MTEGSGHDVVIVGAGFAGLYMVHRALSMGMTAVVLEAGGGVGGTWYWNRYPGARCDVESLQYSYQFSDQLQQEWQWSERYAGQAEILSYLDHVADRFDLRCHIRLGTRVQRAVFDEVSDHWTVVSDDGSEFSARYLVMATGCLSSANIPAFPGLDTFEGATYHTGKWPHEPVDFTGRKVGVVGTGSSGIQSIPAIARQARELVVFQRTAAYSVPAHNRPLDDEEQRAVKADYAAFRQENSQQPFAIGSLQPLTDTSALDAGPGDRIRVYQERWEHGGLSFMGAFNDLFLDRGANATAAEFVRAKIHEIVIDPDVAERLTPTTVIGCKRLCVDTGYYDTFNRDNVELIDVGRSPIDEITPRGPRIGGRIVELDDLVFATGFDAMTGALSRIEIAGRGGRSLGEAWSEGPRTYLGLAVAGFPNLFTITGPGSPSVLTNMVVSIEHHVEWIAACLDYLRDHGYRTIEADNNAQDAWVTYVNDVAGFTLFPSCNSWYLGANVPGKPRVFMPLVGFPPYVEHCDAVASKDYEGFVMSPGPER